MTHLVKEKSQENHCRKDEKLTPTSEDMKLGLKGDTAGRENNTYKGQRYKRAWHGSGNYTQFSRAEALANVGREA